MSNTLEQRMDVMDKDYSVHEKWKDRVWKT